MHAEESSHEPTTSRASCRFPTASRCGLTTYDAKDPGHASSRRSRRCGRRRCAQRARDPARRRRLRRVERVRRPVPHADAERLAASGLKYNRFHTTALCSPIARGPALRPQTTTRWAWAASSRCATGLRPGYNSPAAQHSAQHDRGGLKLKRLFDSTVRQVPPKSRSSRPRPIGPFHHWPPYSGFEHSSGFIGGENNQYLPEPLRRHDAGSNRSARPRGVTISWRTWPNKAIAYVRQQKAIAPRPAVLRLLRARRHASAPHHVPADLDRRSTRASSTRAGTSCARRPSRARRSSASFRRSAS
jgi:arylsulfatase